MKELEVGDLWTVIYSVVHLMKLDEINVYVSCDDLMTYIKLHVVNTEDVLPPVVSLQQDYLSFGCCFCSSLHHRCIFPSWDFTAGHHSLGWQMMSLLVILAWMDTLGISEQTAHNEHIYIKWCWIVTGLAKSKFICTLHHLYRLSYCPSLVDTQVLYSVLKKGV